MLVAILAATGIARADEYDTLRLRWRDMLTQGTNSSYANGLYFPWIASLESSAGSYSSSLNTNANRTNLWSTYPNLATDSSDISGTYGRLRTMALACSVRGSTLENNTTLRSNIISGLDWMYTNYYNPTGVVYDNWFDFEISTPLALNDIVVLLYSNLSPAQIDNYMSAVEHFTPSPAYSSISSNVTAANKVWKSLAVLLRGVIVQDTNKINLGRTALSDVFTNVTSGDGFYQDGSFIFHNFFPYNTGYGVEMLDSIGSMMQLLQGSAWQITDPAQTNVFRWIYDSYQPFIVRGAAMEMVDGRYHTRNGDGHQRGHDLLGAILRIAQVAPPTDAAAYRSFVKGAIQADTYRNFVSKEFPPYNVWADAVVNDTNMVPLPEVTQHRQFPSMDRVMHRTPNWTLGLSMSSSRVANYESTRGENLRGWYTGDGMTYLYNNDLGHYADSFWSTVDPHRLPGTTVDTIIRTNGSGDSYRPSANNQVGGASILGRYGVVAMHLNAWIGTLSARKSWFMFDNEIVCLGNSVSSTDGRGAETIIENRRLGVYGNNAFTVNGAAKPTGPGWSETMVNTLWAHLAGSSPGADIGYYFPSATNVKVLREARSGALYDINTTYGSKTRSTRNYLTMYVDHGTNPSGGAYSYVLLPGMSASTVEAYAANPDIAVVQNNNNATAVKENKLGITAANFWKDTSNYVAGISSDHKAAVILRNDGSVLDIGISDPTQTNTAGINIEVSTTASVILSTDPGVSVLQLSPLRLWVNTSNACGTTLRAKFFIGPVQTNTLAALADAYVQNGPQSVTNFGDASTLQVKLAGATLTREAFMRFDLSSISGTILSANLRLVPTSINEPISNALALVTNNSWIESGANSITWSNKPASNAEFFRWQLGPLFSNVVVPVTPLAQQAVATDGKLSLRIFSTSTGTNGGFTAYGSKEATFSTNRPQLTVISIRTPPTVTLSTSSDCNLDAPGTVMLTADAQDADGTIVRVDFYNGATRVAQVFAPPYNAAVPNLAPGTGTFTAIAVDNSGLMTTSGPVSVSVYAPEPAGRGTGLVGEYYSDQAEFVNLKLTRTDTNINFNFTTRPVPGDHLSIRWTGKLQAQHSGPHQFHADTDEGVRLWIDGRLIVDNWTAHPPYEVEDTGSISLVAGRYYNITMEYFDKNGAAVARLFWTQPGGAKEIIPQSQLYPADQGLRATYFYNTTVTDKAFTRIDDAVNFAWGTNSPDPTILSLPFSARWTGKVKANAAGQYQFFTLSDDAVRLWVNGQLIINNWTAHALTEDSNTINLAAGQFYELTMEYFNATGLGTAVLSWHPPGEAKQVVPVSNLTPHQNNNPPVLAFVTNQLAARNSLLTFTASTVDSDAPLTYSLDAGAPVGATVNPANGVFSWTPSNSQAFGPYNVTLRVTDNGVPQMTDAQTFTITVLTNPTLAFVRFGDAAVLSWPQWAGSVQLYGATNLTPPVTWLPVTNSPVLSNGQWAVQVSGPTNGSQFFRLQTP
jgi:hyaluronate lyase